MFEDISDMGKDGKSAEKLPDGREKKTYGKSVMKSGTNEK